MVDLSYIIQDMTDTERTIETTNPLVSTNGSLYLYSLAISTPTGILHKLSIQYDIFF